MSKFSNEYYDPNHPGYKSRIAARKKLGAIVKMKPGKEPPAELVRMRIGEGIYTIDAYADELQALAKDPNVVSIEYARPTHQLTKIARFPRVDREKAQT